jgi:hypothetical protein
MTYIGFDHHKKWTQAAAIDDQVKVIREMRVLNDSCSLKGFLSRIVKRLAESKSKDLTPHHYQDLTHYQYAYQGFTDKGMKRGVGELFTAGEASVCRSLAVTVRRERRSLHGT